MREDLAAGEHENVPRRPSTHPPHHEDIFCIVMRWMHSHQAAGPVLALPPARFALLRSPGPLQKKMATVSMPPERKRELQDLAALLEFMSESWGLDFSYYRAAQALRALADEQLPPPVVHHWLWTPDPQHQGPLQRKHNRYFNNIPDMTWSLLARFRRLPPG